MGKPIVAETIIKSKLIGCDLTDSTGAGLTGVPDSGILVHSTGTTATLRSLWKDLSSSGWIEGFEITDAGGETVNVAIGEFIIRSGATSTSPIYYENTIAGLTGVAIPTDTTRYLIGSWNSGTPSISFSATDTSNGYSLIYLGEVHNRGGVLKIHPDARPVGDFVNRSQGWAQRTIGDRVSSGLVTYDPAAPSRKIAVTAGAIEVARSMDQEIISLFDSNAGGTFTAIYGTGTYTYVATQTQWDNTQYDNAGVLTAMTVGWYSNKYVIQGYLGDVAVQYGRAQYATEAEAIAEATPADRPEEYVEHGMVIAKITFLKSAASPSTITDLRPVIGSSAPTALAPTSHPNLTTLAWTSSGHTGTASTVAGFDSGGVAADKAYREVLTAARTYYVRTDGSDANTGLVNTAGGAFLTIQKAVDTAAMLDTSIYDVTIQVDDGTYTTPITLKDPVGSGTVTILGNTTTPANVLISTTSATGIYGASSTKYTVRAVKVTTTTTGHGVYVNRGSSVVLWSVDFGAVAAGYTQILVYGGSTIFRLGSSAISGGGGFHYNIAQCSRLVWTGGGNTITVTGSPAFSVFAYVTSGSSIYDVSNTYTGAVTGTRFSIVTGGAITTGGGGINYYPGSIVGNGGTTTGGGFRD